MKKIIQIGDQLAVSISLICAIHCFLAPVLVVMVPSFQTLSIADDEVFHFWLMIGVLPTSFVTLAMGCRRHKKYTFLAIGLFGLSVMAVASLWVHDWLGCDYERWATLVGSCIIVFAHINNYLLCRKKNCDVHETPAFSGCSGR